MDSALDLESEDENLVLLVSFITPGQKSLTVVNPSFETSKMGTLICRVIELTEINLGNKVLCKTYKVLNVLYVRCYYYILVTYFYKLSSRKENVKYFGHFCHLHIH